MLAVREEPLPSEALRRADRADGARLDQDAGGVGDDDAVPTPGAIANYGRIADGKGCTSLRGNLLYLPIGPEADELAVWGPKHRVGALGSLERGCGEGIQPLNPNHRSPLVSGDHRYAATHRLERQPLPD